MLMVNFHVKRWRMWILEGGRRIISFLYSNDSFNVVRNEVFFFLIGKNIYCKSVSRKAAVCIDCSHHSVLVKAYFQHNALSISHYYLQFMILISVVINGVTWVANKQKKTKTNHSVGSPGSVLRVIKPTFVCVCFVFLFFVFLGRSEMLFGKMFAELNIDGLSGVIMSRKCRCTNNIFQQIKINIGSLAPVSALCCCNNFTVNTLWTRALRETCVEMN